MTKKIVGILDGSHPLWNTEYNKSWTSPEQERICQLSDLNCDLSSAWLSSLTVWGLDLQHQVYPGSPGWKLTLQMLDLTASIVIRANTLKPINQLINQSLSLFPSPFPLPHNHTHTQTQMHAHTHTHTHSTRSVSLDNSNNIVFSFCWNTWKYM